MNTPKAQRHEYADTNPKPGIFVISLDFEKMWGVRDHVRPSDPYAQSILDVDRVVPATLAIFKKYEIAATWATVGLLFADSLKEAREFWPEVRPNYQNKLLNPYLETELENSDERLWLAPDLIQQISDTPAQELATHTFSHYYCREPGQTTREFEADLAAAQRIAQAKDHALSTIIFPRHHWTSESVTLLPKHGINCWRNDPESWTHKTRVTRYLDSFLPIALSQCSKKAELPSELTGLVSIRASQFFRPYKRATKHLENLKISRMIAGVREAAHKGEIYHLWWHPHNFSHEMAANLDALELVLEEVSRLKKSLAMRSLTMSDMATEALAESLPT